MLLGQEYNRDAEMHHMLAACQQSEESFFIRMDGPYSSNDVDWWFMFVVMCTFLRMNKSFQSLSPPPSDNYAGIIKDGNRIYQY